MTNDEMYDVAASTILARITCNDSRMPRDFADLTDDQERAILDLIEDVEVTLEWDE